MNLLSSSSVGDAIVKVLGDWPLWTAIFATIFVIGLGYFLTRKNILNKEWEKVFIKIVMVVGLPALAFQGFLNDADADSVISELWVIGIGFAFYLLMSLIAKFFFYKENKDVKDTLSMCIAFGSTTFFGIPLINALAGGIIDDGAILTANNFNIPYRIFLYTLGFTIMSTPAVETVKSLASSKKVLVQDGKTPFYKLTADKKANIKKQLKNIFFNPIVIMTFLGLFIWVTQLIPGIKVVDYGNGAFSPLRIDLLFPPAKKIIDTLAAICTPLSWVAIGMTIAKGNVKEAVKNKTVWLATFIRIMIVPLIALIIMVGVSGIGYAINPAEPILKGYQLTVILIMAATPPANVIVAYAINFNKQPEMASNVTTLSTIGAIIAMPIWVVVGVALGSTALFAV